MKRTALPLLLLLVSFVFASLAQAQARRPVETFFVRPHVGLSSYVGDNDAALFSSEDGFPYNIGLELGYQFTLPLSLGLGYQIGQYPGINDSPALPDGVDVDDVRHTLRALLRYTFGGATGPAPYLQTGAHVSFGKVTTFAPPQPRTESNETAFGALFGAGLDVPVSNRTSFFVDVTTHPSFPDDAIDGNEDDGAGNFDLLTTLGVGLKINFKTAYVAPQVLRLEGPTRLEAGAPGTFTATTNDAEATQPVTYRWDWGDGSFATGQTATHTFASPGTYNVRFEASNQGGADSRSMTVQVVPPPEPAVIVSVTANPRDPDTRTEVRFNATTRGDEPLRYDWTFGDGTGSIDPAPTHVFEQPGTYTVTLDLSNDVGSDTRSMTITVLPYEAEICREITEMSPAFFDRNSSTLNDAARSTLRENLQILQQCPNMNARLVGYAAPGERNPQRLSEDRARAVEQFYTANGVAASRLLSIGEGVVSGVTSKKGGAAQLQRVDTIPVR